MGCRGAVAIVEENPDDKNQDMRKRTIAFGAAVGRKLDKTLE